MIVCFLFACHRESVHIEVQSVNGVWPDAAVPRADDDDDDDAVSNEAAAPASGSTWERESYTLEVEENRLYDDILQLEIEGLSGDALRRCQFYIDTPDVPFVIDNQGTVKLYNCMYMCPALEHNWF